MKLICKQTTHIRNAYQNNTKHATLSVYMVLEVSCYCTPPYPNSDFPTRPMQKSMRALISFKDPRGSKTSSSVLTDVFWAHQKTLPQSIPRPQRCTTHILGSNMLLSSGFVFPNQESQLQVDRPERFAGSLVCQLLVRPCSDYAWRDCNTAILQPPNEILRCFWNTKDNMHQFQDTVPEKVSCGQVKYCEAKNTQSLTEV